MPKFKLTYARVVILEREIEAENKHAAEAIAHDLERDGRLAIYDVEDNYVEYPTGCIVRDIEDYDVIWEIEEI